MPQKDTRSSGNSHSKSSSAAERQLDKTMARITARELEEQSNRASPGTGVAASGSLHPIPASQPEPKPPTLPAATEDALPVISLQPASEPSVIAQVGQRLEVEIPMLGGPPPQSTDPRPEQDHAQGQNPELGEAWVAGHASAQAQPTPIERTEATSTPAVTTPSASSEQPPHTRYDNHAVDAFAVFLLSPITFALRQQALMMEIALGLLSTNPCLANSTRSQAQPVRSS